MSSTHLFSIPPTEILHEGLHTVTSLAGIQLCATVIPDITPSVSVYEAMLQELGGLDTRSHRPKFALRQSSSKKITHRMTTTPPPLPNWLAPLWPFPLIRPTDANQGGNGKGAGEGVTDTRPVFFFSPPSSSLPPLRVFVLRRFLPPTTTVCHICHDRRSDVALVWF